MRLPSFDRRTAAAAAGLLTVTGCLLAAGCSATGSSPSSSSPANGAAAAQPAAAPAAHAAAGSSAGRGGAALAVLPGPGAQSIIYTASLTVRVADLGRAAAAAAQLARADGGYLASEHTAIDRAHPAQSTVSLQLKIPAAGYQQALAILSAQLGTRLTLDQQAQDVTQTVADVSSRVTSAQDAITALRALLTRAGSVTSLLDVQNQINAEEASLEELLAQQRALAHETAFGTVSLLLVSKPVPAVKHAKKAGGFAGGLAAGWHGLVRVVSALLTAAGAALPFAVVLALLGGVGYLVWHRLPRRRAVPPAPAPGGGPGAAE
ncbi:MAG: DUF4349 domain-containing protein [Streptosporangiales bacterium]